MLSPRWRKVLRDLWGNKGRTLMVVISIAIGVFAVGMIAGSQAGLTSAMNESWSGTNPPDVMFFTGHYGDRLLATVRHMPGVAEADGFTAFNTRFHTATNPELRRLALMVYPDFDDIRVSKVRPETETWPPGAAEVVIERSSMAWMGIQEGDEITVETSDGRERTLRVVGTAYDARQMNAAWTANASGFASLGTLDKLASMRGMNRLDVTAEGARDEESLNALSQRIRAKIEGTGTSVDWTYLPPQGEHPASEVMEPIGMLLGVMGGLSLILSGFLVTNTMQAILAQQVRQMGIMKAIGARDGQVFGIYYTMVAAYGLLALMVAVPLGALGARWQTGYMASLINFDTGPLTLPLSALALEVAVGLAVPLLAALYPTLSAAHRTARDAMNDYGIASGKPAAQVAAGIGKFVSRPIMLSLRNTFRRKGRLALTLVTLVLAGGICISVFSVQSSVSLTLDELEGYLRYDVQMNLRDSARIDYVENEALTVPGVVAAEAWRIATARRMRQNGSEGDPIVVSGSPADSDLAFPILSEGRWLLPEDENAVVVNGFLLKDEPDISVGDDILLKLNGDETTWRVVGIADKTPPTAMVFVNSDYLGRLTNQVGRAASLYVSTEPNDPESQTRVAQGLKDHFEGLGMKVYSVDTHATERQTVAGRFSVLVIFLGIMAALMAVVGGIGLAGTMSLNVLERTREVGVMRAIGATNGAIRSVVLAEGIVIGLMSWVSGALLATVLGKVLANAVGMMTMATPLTYSYSTTGAVIWLAVALAIATIASLWPARNATHISVREALAYQ